MNRARSFLRAGRPWKGRLLTVCALFALLVFIVPSLAFADDGDSFRNAANVGMWKAGLVAFGIGFVTSLTPCVYPMIAITVSVFGAKQAKSRKHAMLLSTSFVLGMMLLFTTFFVTASLGGKSLSWALQQKGTFIFIAAVFIGMAASMFGAFELKLPDSLTQRLSGVGGNGYAGAFVLGLVTGPLATPCAGPFLLPMALVVGDKGSYLFGTVVGGCYALGLGTLFWVVGTFASALPKGGRWMIWVKAVSGIVMLVLALYYLKNVIHPLEAFPQHTTTFLVAAGAAVLLGLALGAVHLNWDDGGIVVKLRKVLGVAAAVVGAFVFVGAISKPREVSADELAKIQAEAQKQADDRAKSAADRVADLERQIGAETDGAKKADLQKQLDEAKGEMAAAEKAKKVYPPLSKDWLSDLEKAKAQAKDEGRPMIIDFGATWCEACKELERQTFNDAKVMATAGRFVAVRIDASNDDDPKVIEIKKAYGVSELPAVILVDSTGKEAKRFSKFIEPPEFLAMIEPIN